jgi:hypothetical protein
MKDIFISVLIFVGVFVLLREHFRSKYYRKKKRSKYDRY